jgi:hypothetical protein
VYVDAGSNDTAPDSTPARLAADRSSGTGPLIDTARMGIAWMA